MRSSVGQTSGWKGDGVAISAEGTIQAPQRHRQRHPLVALYTANLVSYVGDMMMFLAIPWFVLQTTGSVAKTGIAAFFTTGSVAVAALLGSSLVDRLGFRRASVASDLASGAGVALIPLLYLTVGLPFWGLLGLVFVAGLLTTPGATARSALVPDLAALADVRIERATALTDGINRLSRFIGAPLAGVLIVVIGTSNLLWIDAATFLSSALLIGLLVPRRIPTAAPHEAALATPATIADEAPLETIPARRRLFGNARDGIRFIVHDPVLFGTELVVLVGNMLDAGFGSVLAPAFVKQMYGSAVVLGTLIAAFGGAAFVGALTFGAIGHRLPRRPTLGWSYLLGGATRFFWVLLLAPVLPLLVAVYALCGFCIGPVNPLFSTLDYERVPVDKRARVFGAMTAGSFLGSPLGGLLAGGLVPAIGLRPCILLFGVIYLLATGTLLVNPALKAIDRPVGRKREGQGE
jgi:MFS family permease